MIEAIIYLLAITVAEVVTAFGYELWKINPLGGIVCYIVILVTVIIRSAQINEKSHQQLILSLALVPLIRIISLSMPLANIPQLWWYPIIYVPLLAAVVMVVRILDYRPEQVGLTLGWLPTQLAVGLTGLVFGVVEYFILREEAEVTAAVLQETWLLAP